MNNINKETIENVNNLLKLPSTGREQDWAIELADKNRIREFLGFLENFPLSSNEKLAIMSLVLSSFDDYLCDNEDLDMWNEIIIVANKERNTYDDIFNYWACWENESDDVFNITPFVRNYMKDS